MKLGIKMGVERLKKSHVTGKETEHILSEKTGRNHKFMMKRNLIRKYRLKRFLWGSIYNQMP